MQDDLKPCPKCAAPAKVEHITGQAWGECQRCEFEGPVAYEKDVRREAKMILAAVHLWNTRTEGPSHD